MTQGQCRRTRAAGGAQWERRHGNRPSGLGGTGRIETKRDSGPERSDCGSACQAGTLDTSTAASLHNTWKSSCVGRGVRLPCKNVGIRAAGSSLPIACREGRYSERGGFLTGAASVALGWGCATGLGGKELSAACTGSRERLGSNPSPHLGTGSSITKTPTFR